MAEVWRNLFLHLLMECYYLSFNSRIMKKLLLFVLTFIFVGSVCNFGFSQNYSLEFDGIDDYVNGTHSGELNFTNTFSFSCWVYLTSITGDRQFIFENAQSNGANAQYIFGISDIGQIYFYGSSLPNPQGVYLGETTLTLNEWSYISVTYDNQSLTIYLNGELDTTYTSSGSMYQYGHTNYIMGCYLYNNTQNFSGKLDALSVWNIALDQAQIQSYMCNPPLSTTTGLVGMWWFNEGSGIIAVDSSQYQNDGIINGPVWSTNIPVPSSSAGPAGPISGPTLVQQGQSGIEYSIPAIANATGYTWSVPFGATIASGSNNDTITVDFGATAQSGDIIVYGTNACGDGTPDTMGVAVGFNISVTFLYNNSANTALDSLWIFLLNNGTKIDSTQTNLNGECQFTGIAPGTYTLSATTGKPWGGVNATDAIKIQRHFVGLEPLTIPVRLLAGDVNNSNFIKIMALRKPAHCGTLY